MELKKILYQENSKNENNFKLLGIFNSLMIVSLLLCDVFIFKTVQLFGFTLALSGCIFPITSLVMICVNEVYGHKQAAKTLINLIIAQMLFLTGLVFLPKIPSPGGYAPDIVNAYNVVFHDVWRVYLSSPVGILVTLYLSSMINSKLKTYFWGRYLFPRLIINTVITTAILVSVIYPINFYNILTWPDIFYICLDTYIYKVCMAFVVVIFSQPVIHLAKKIEKKYIFDVNISFNPFLIYSNKCAGINLYDKESN